jgi:20S proteasome alpha/beta subunit
VVIAALKRNSSELAARHEKIFPISFSAGIAVSGLVADGHQIAAFLRNTAINSSFVYNREARVAHLSAATAKKLQVNLGIYNLIVSPIISLDVHTTCISSSIRGRHTSGRF